MDKSELVIKAKPNSKSSHRTFSVRMRTDLVDELDRLSEETGRSRNELISIFLEYACKNCIIEK